MPSSSLCPVCLEAIEPDTLVAVAACEHVLCLSCALSWYVRNSGSSCPYCRQVPQALLLTTIRSHVVGHSQVHQSHDCCMTVESDDIEHRLGQSYIPGLPWPLCPSTRPCPWSCWPGSLVSLYVSVCVCVCLRCWGDDPPGRVLNKHRQ